MADNGERNDGASDERNEALPEPVDLSARREERQRARVDNANGVSEWERWSEGSEELERQAREVIQTIRENMGELGDRVRQTIEHAQALWNESAQPSSPVMDDPHPDELRARALARRWVKRDFLVDPDLPASMSVISLNDTEVWRIELRERGETRAMIETTDPYTGTRPPEPGPLLPVWDYLFPSSPEIEAGERRERILHVDILGVCERCHGSGNRLCAHCEGKGLTICPECRGRGRKVCPRCRGRGQIADAAAERHARAAKSYFQVHAERLAQNAVERLADLSERLRQEYGAPLPPSAEWAPTAPASGKTVPCPDCVDGYLPCVCNNGKVACEVCHGSAREACPDCHGSGQVIRHKEVARRFDTRIRTRLAPPADTTDIEWIGDEMFRRASGEIVWEGADDELDGAIPPGAPEHVWKAAAELRRAHAQEALREQVSGSLESEAASGRHVLSRRVILTRTPITRMEYAFAGRAYEAVAVGPAGDERFWANEFPPRWHRVTRFFQAVVRDINGESTRGPRDHYDLRPTYPPLAERTDQEDTTHPMLKGPDESGDS